MSNPAASPVLDHTPPQNVELEQCVLGAIMIAPKDAYQAVAGLLTPDSFYLDGHSLIFELMGELHGRGIPPDSVALLDELRSRGLLERVGGSAYVMALLNQVAGAANVDHHARKVADKATLRGVIRGCTGVIEECYRQELPVGDVTDKLYTLAVDFAAAGAQEGSTSAGDALAEYLALEKGRGLPSGFPELDRITRGFKSGQFWVVGAATKMGKTAFAMQIAAYLAIDCKIPVCFINLEMDKLEVAERLLCQQTLDTSGRRATGVCTYRLDAGDLNHTERHLIGQAQARIERAPLYIRDLRAPKIADIRAALRWEVREHGIKLAVVDYLGRIKGDNGRASLYEQVTQVSTDTKSLARELGIPIIMPHQLNRAVSSRRDQDCRPQLSDLRESGAIEQDADVVLFVYRPSYYGVREPAWCEHAGTVWSKECGYMPAAEIIVAANRHGESGVAPAYWYGAITRYVPVAPAEGK